MWYFKMNFFVKSTFDCNNKKYDSTDLNLVRSCAYACNIQVLMNAIYWKAVELLHSALFLRRADI